MYLISAMKYDYAFVMAKELGLKRYDWTYVPEDIRNKVHRKEVLKFKTVEDESYLIGSFSDEERANLLKGKR